MYSKIFVLSLIHVWFIFRNDWSRVFVSLKKNICFCGFSLTFEKCWFSYGFEVLFFIWSPNHNDSFDNPDKLETVLGYLFACYPYRFVLHICILDVVMFHLEQRIIFTFYRVPIMVFRVSSSAGWCNSIWQSAFFLLPSRLCVG